MTRYLIFEGQKYYPARGTEDLESIYEDFPEARAFYEEVKKDLKILHWCQLYDVYKDEILACHTRNEEGELKEITPKSREYKQIG